MNSQSNSNIRMKSSHRDPKISKQMIRLAYQNRMKPGSSTLQSSQPVPNQGNWQQLQS